MAWDTNPPYSGSPFSPLMGGDTEMSLHIQVSKTWWVRPSRRCSHWYPNAHCLIPPLEEEEPEQERGDLSQENGGDLTFWLNGPQCTEACEFYPLHRGRHQAGLRPGQVPSRQYHLHCSRPSERLSRAGPLSVLQAESANWTRRRMSPEGLDPRGPKAQPEVWSEH